MSDAENVEKAMSTLRKIVLGFFIAPITLASIYWMFDTTLATKEGLAIVAKGQEAIVRAMDRNTDAIKEGNKDNAEEHGVLAEVIHGTTTNVGITNAKMQALNERIERVQDECDKHKNGEH